MRSLILSALATVALAMPALAQNAANVGGTYRVDGTNASGGRYSGTAVITVTSQNTCRIQWRSGGNFSGICMRNGSSFAAAYTGSITGLVIYEIRPDGSLRGLWTVADQSGVGTEILTPVR